MKQQGIGITEQPLTIRNQAIKQPIGGQKAALFGQKRIQRLCVWLVGKRIFELIEQIAKGKFRVGIANGCIMMR